MRSADDSRTWEEAFLTAVNLILARMSSFSPDRRILLKSQRFVGHIGHLVHRTNLILFFSGIVVSKVHPESALSLTSMPYKYP